MWGCSDNGEAAAGASSSIAAGSKCLARWLRYVDAKYLEKLFWVDGCQKF
jgi:hypothetical protein